MALLALAQRYRATGWDIDGGELPDHLPVVLEFAALTGPGSGEAPLRELAAPGPADQGRRTRPLRGLRRRGVRPPQTFVPPLPAPPTRVPSGAAARTEDAR